jgi:hypothetical protein
VNHLISQFKFVTSSYLARVRFSIDEQRRQPSQCRVCCRMDYFRKMDRRIFGTELLVIVCPHFGSVVDNKLRLVHGRESHDDDIDRDQDPQGVLGS